MKLRDFLIMLVVLAAYLLIGRYDYQDEVAYNEYRAAQVETYGLGK